MLNLKGNIYLWGLLLITMVSICTSCTNNSHKELVDNNLVVGSTKNEISKDMAKNDNQSLDIWLGDYIFTEYINSDDYTKFYEVFISKENNDYYAKIKTIDEGSGVYSYLKAKISGDINYIDFIFNDYLPDEDNTNKPYKLGDNLLGFTKTGTGISTHWGKIVPNNDINKVDGTYFKLRQNSEGYIGHWYASLPYTGGNSTTIEIKEMSNTSVSFHVYFCRTYYYDGTNIKLENNIAKFVDNGDYKTSGTIEFTNKSIIVTIEKTDLPILKTGKTVFNYKVSEFNAVHITPNNGAAEVDLGKGIEIDFGRKISPTVNPTASVRKANVPNGSADGFVDMNAEIKGNKLIFLPDHDAMKAFNEVIEPGQKYEFHIGEGEYRDNSGNINNEINLEFTTKNNSAISAENTENKPENIKIKALGNSLNDFIPKNWKLINKVEGDLNKDNLKDIAAVIEYTGEHQQNDNEEWFGQPRILFIVFKNNDGTYKLSIQSSKVILRSDMGGVYGDPFVGIKYSRGSIIISSYGGSAWRWGFTNRYRFQDDGWYLIGTTELSEFIHTSESETIDTNCLTGDETITTIDKNGEKKVITQNIGKQKLEKLTDN